MVPVPRVQSMEELDELVAAGDDRNDRRRIFGRPLSVAQHFEIESPALRRLPETRFDPKHPAQPPGRHQVPLAELVRVHPRSRHGLHPSCTVWSLRGSRGGSVQLAQARQ